MSRAWWTVPGPDGGILELRQVDLPSPGPAQVLVRVRAAGVNRGELIGRAALRRDNPQARPAPSGNEFAGDIVALGAGVQDWTVGARVMGRGAGGHADYIVVPTRALWRIPDALTFPAAAALPNVVVTAHDAIVTNAALTAGAVTHDDKAVGFRVYDRFQESHASHGQVVVFDSDTGDFMGVIVGGHLGAMRTGAIGGVAIKHMARPDASRAAILGSGRQARTHLEAAAVVRHFASVKVYSLNATHREAFASEMRETLDLNVDPVLSAQEAVADADVVMCVTKSTTPVFDPSWLKPGAHVNTVGPRAQGESELDASIAGRVRVVATDSLRQLRSYATPYFLAETPWMEAMVDLGDMVVGKHTGRQSPDDITLFCTAGLSGTEVAVASEALRRAGHSEGL